MSEQPKKLSLTQVDSAETIAKRVIKQKIGDVKELAGVQEHSGAIVEGADTPEHKLLETAIIEALQTIYDPEIPLNIYDLGLIYRLILGTGGNVKVEMTLTAPGCPVAGAIVEEVRRKVDAVDGVSNVEVELVWEPPWTKERLSEEARLELGMM
jgi:FeS assembly SUF system protein